MTGLFFGFAFGFITVAAFGFGFVFVFAAAFAFGFGAGFNAGLGFCLGGWTVFFEVVFTTIVFFAGLGFKVSGARAALDFAVLTFGGIFGFDAGAFLAFETFALVFGFVRRVISAFKILALFGFRAFPLFA